MNKEYGKHRKTNRKEYDFYSNFDLDGFGEEIFVDEWQGKTEYKTEAYENWSKNGNIYIEFQQSFYKGKDIDGNNVYSIPEYSGIYTTEADIWVHHLKDEEGRLRHAPIYLQVKELKRLIKTNVFRTAVSYHYDTSNVKTEGFLIPLEIIKKYFYNFFD
jgi:hypothetical protein